MQRPMRAVPSPSSIVVSALFLGIVVLVAAWGTSRAVAYLTEGTSPAWMSVFVNYSTMLAVTLILVLASSMGDPSGFGFALPRRGSFAPGVRWGLLLGVAATIVALLSGAGSASVMGGLGFWQMVLLVWVFASVAEEILVRGYVQSYLEPLRAYGFSAFGVRFSVPVLLSAIFFSCMHLVLLARGTSFQAVYIIMVFTFFLGLVAAYHSEKSDSVLPPIAAHMFFNIGGVIGAILFVILQIVIFGRSAAEVARIIVG